MFENNDRLVKFGNFVLVCGVLLCIISLLVGCTLLRGFNGFLLGLIIGLSELLAAVGLSLKFFLLAELTEVNQTLKIGFAKEISAQRNLSQERTQELKRREEQARQADEKEKRKKREMEEAKEAAKRAKEAAKQARIAAYWEQHAEEKKILLEKRATAENSLNKLGGLAGQQRETLQNLIREIDWELTRDREGNDGTER